VEAVYGGAKDAIFTLTSAPLSQAAMHGLPPPTSRRGGAGKPLTPMEEAALREVPIGFGRIVATEIEASNILHVVNLVIGMTWMNGSTKRQFDRTLGADGAHAGAAEPRHPRGVGGRAALPRGVASGHRRALPAAVERRERQRRWAGELVILPDPER
jgi:hypothetical protein